MSPSIFFIALSLLVFFSQSAIAEMSFQAETARATKELKCRPRVIRVHGRGALYGCVVGSAQTVKFFMNETVTGSQVENVKLMWNDWLVDIGDGIHTDKDEAVSFVKAFAKLYAPSMENKLLSTFFSNSNRTIELSDYRITYTYSKGPKIGERLFTLTPKATTVGSTKVRSNE